MYKRFTLTAIFIRFVLANARPTLACGYEQYRVKGEGTCRQCPVCKEGYGLNECRSDIIYDPGEQPTCSPCIDGQTFSSHDGSGPCDSCSPIDKDQREIRKCTRVHDRMTECKRGYFENKGHHQCSQQCCYCDGKTKPVEKCVRDNVSEGMFCAPTRWDGKCEPRIKTTPVQTTKASTKSSKIFEPSTNTPAPSTDTPIPSTNTSIPSTNTPIPVGTSTEFSNSTSTANSSTNLSTESSSVSTTSRPTLPRPTVAVPTVPSVKTEPTPFPEMNITSPTVVPTHNTERTYIAVIVLATALLCTLIAIVCLFAYRRWESCLERNSRTKIYEVNVPSAHNYARVADSSGASSENSSVRSSRVVEGEGHASVAGSQDLLLTALHNNAAMTPLLPNVQHDYAVCGRIKLSSLEYSQRKSLGEMLDAKIKGLKKNWRDIGMYLAKGDEPLKINIEKCHECYYGGGNATICLFERLEQEKPDLTVDQFIETSRELRRFDVISYLSEKSMNIFLFINLFHEQKEHIARFLEKRLENGHYWPSYAEKLLGLSSDAIDLIQQQKRIPQKYSPTMEMIKVLCAHKPEITVEEFQAAADELGRDDVKEFLEEIIRKTLHEGDV